MICMNCETQHSPEGGCPICTRTASERKLRRMLALEVSGKNLYTDDGEISDSSEVPHIDFLRDSVEVIEAKIRERRSNLISKQYEGDVCVIDYTDWRGERYTRRIQPLGIEFGATEWHPEPQWLMRAIDLRDSQEKTFALKDIHIFSGSIQNWTTEGRSK